MENLVMSLNIKRIAFLNNSHKTKTQTFFEKSSIGNHEDKNEAITD